MSDFDASATNDIVLAKYSDSSLVPVRGRECSSEQTPDISERFPTFEEFANADVKQIYGAQKVESAFKLEANEFASMVLENNSGKFSFKPLPRLAQLSSINGTEVMDINKDGHPDLIIAGNMYGAEVETSRYDASIGLVLLGDGQMSF